MLWIALKIYHGAAQDFNAAAAAYDVMLYLSC
jgi:hypothetical protein